MLYVALFEQVYVIFKPSDTLSYVYYRYLHVFQRLATDKRREDLRLPKEYSMRVC